jgi:hypothetical protein
MWLIGIFGVSVDIIGLVFCVSWILANPCSRSNVDNAYSKVEPLFGVQHAISHDFSKIYD